MTQMPFLTLIIINFIVLACIRMTYGPLGRSGKIGLACAIAAVILLIIQLIANHTY